MMIVKCSWACSHPSPLGGDMGSSLSLFLPLSYCRLLIKVRGAICIDLYYTCEVCSVHWAELELGTGGMTDHRKSHVVAQSSAAGPFHMKHDQSVFFLRRPIRPTPAWSCSCHVLYVITPCYFHSEKRETY